MSRTLASWSFYFAKTNRGVVTTTCISEANSQEVITQPATWKEWEDCPTHLAEGSTTPRDVFPFGDLPTNRWENDLFSWLYGRSDCADVNHCRYEMPNETFHMMLTIRYPAMGEGGGDADLSLVIPCRFLKMHTDHVIYRCLVQKTVNHVRTIGKTGNMAWSIW